MQIGNLLQIDFDIESREYNNKWYTDIKAWKIEVAGTSTQKIHDNEVNTVDFIQNSEKKRRIAILKKKLLCTLAAQVSWNFASTNKTI